MNKAVRRLERQAEYAARLHRLRVRTLAHPMDIGLGAIMALALMCLGGTWGLLFGVALGLGVCCGAWNRRAVLREWREQIPEAWR